jgi:HD-GYP domain-containing protein (c-di-GMP phosphodiesterase class II)
MTHTSEHPMGLDAASALVEELVAALINTRIYQRQHPRVQRSIAAVQSHLEDLGGDDGEVIRLVLADSLLVFRQRPLVGASLAASRLIDAVSAWKAGGIDFESAATCDEINELFVCLIAKPEHDATNESANARLAAAGCRSIRLLPPYSEALGMPGVSSGRSFNVPVRLYQNIIDHLQTVTVTVCHGGRIQFDPVKSHAEEVLRRLESDEGPLMSLARQDQYDAFTFSHSVRVAVLSLNFGRALTDDREMLIRLGTAALLHDVGKSLIPFEILHSRTTLTEEERREMGRHPELGAELLLDHHESDPMSVCAAFGHHKSGDRGYPRTVHDHRISTVTEVIKICDVYEALTAARPYKKPMTPTRAYRIMLSMTNQFNPRLLRRFIEVNGIYPTGQVVSLDSGETARVIRQSNELLAPVVQIVGDRDGNILDDVDRPLVDLSALSLDAPRCILQAVQDDASGL